MDSQPRPQERITIAEPQLHSNSNVLVDGQVISANESSVLVQLDGETLPRSFPLTAVRKSSAVYGADRTDPYDNQVINAIPRR